MDAAPAAAPVLAGEGARSLPHSPRNPTPSAPPPLRSVLTVGLDAKVRRCRPFHQKHGVCVEGGHHGVQLVPPPASASGDGRGVGLRSRFIAHAHAPAPQADILGAAFCQVTGTHPGIFPSSLRRPSTCATAAVRCDGVARLVCSVSPAPCDSSWPDFTKTSGKRSRSSQNLGEHQAVRCFAPWPVSASVLKQWLWWDNWLRAN